MRKLCYFLLALCVFLSPFALLSALFSERDAPANARIEQRYPAPSASPAIERAGATADEAAGEGAEGTSCITPGASQSPAAAKMRVALTFDDGPYTVRSAQVLDRLERYGVVATFFVLGSRIEGREELLLRMEALGCEIGIHTWSHVKLSTLSTDAALEEINRTNEAIRQVLGHGATLVRPPWGQYSKAQAAACGLPFILWSVDSEDWHPRDPNELARQVEEQVFDGAIILMHDIQSSTPKALDLILPALLERGYRFVTVSDLLLAPEGGKVYNKG